MYRSESHFSRALVKKLTGCLVQRIESGLTGVGIPDIYLRYPSREVWLELKNDKHSNVNDKWWKIKWRKGQQAWALNYYRTCGLYTYTVVALSDGFIVIPMDKVYVSGIVKQEDVCRMTMLKDIIRVIKDEVKKSN